MFYRAVIVAGLLASATFNGSAWAAGRSTKPVPSYGQSAIAHRGYFYVGGAYLGKPGEQRMHEQMYVEVLTPRHPRQRYPLVLVHGAAQTATNWMGTPDGRPGWADYFVAQGYTVYMVDQPARGRSPWLPDVDGKLATFAAEAIESRFTAPEAFNLWPQAKLHSQWPGTGRIGDPVFDAFYATQVPYLADGAETQRLNRQALEFERDRDLPLFGITSVLIEQVGACPSRRGDRWGIVSNARSPLTRFSTPAGCERADPHPPSQAAGTKSKCGHPRGFLPKRDENIVNPRGNKGDALMTWIAPVTTRLISVPRLPPVWTAHQESGTPAARAAHPGLSSSADFIRGARMRARRYLLAWAVATAASASPDRFAAAAPPMPAEIIKIMTADTVVEPDGSYTTVSHLETTATNDSAARNIAQHPVEYSDSMEKVEILEAFNRKVDGRILQVDPTQIFAQAPPGSPRLQMFNDRMQKVIVFPDVGAQDTLVYTVKHIRKAPFPGQFFFGGVFARGFPFEDVRINITLPAAMAAHIEYDAGVDHEVVEAGQNVTHKFVYRNPRPRSAGGTALSSWDTEPYYIISTFADYAAIARAYRELSAGKAAVTPRIQSLADEITAGATDRRDQAKRLYDWVSKHIRYVAVVLGNGGYVPHDAATVLDNGYGDCKDHVVLLEALLAAKGIASLPALIDSGNRYQTPDAAATPAAFNHVLSYLPEFGIYADSTIGVAPFGTLAAAEYGKSIVLAADADPGLRVLPLVAAEENQETLRTTAELMPDGSVSGQSTTTAGPFSVTLRQEAARIEAGGREKMVATQLRTLGWPGRGSSEFDPPRDQLGPTYTVSGSFELEARPEFLDGKPFALPAGLRLIVRPGEFLLGSWNVSKLEPTPCVSGHQVEELSVTLPPGRDITSLPGGKTVENRYLTYHSDWTQAGRVVTVRREISVKVPVAVCRDGIRATLSEAIAQIRGDYRSELALKPLVQ